jgi:hypothetical protein
MGMDLRAEVEFRFRDDEPDALNAAANGAEVSRASSYAPTSIPVFNLGIDA